jgi:hypothetical protein
VGFIADHPAGILVFPRLDFQQPGVKPVPRIRPELAHSKKPCQQRFGLFCGSPVGLPPIAILGIFTGI